MKILNSRQVAAGLIGGATLALGASGAAMGASLQASMPVSINLVGGCSSFSVAAMDFGSVDLSAPQATATTADISLNCPAAVAWTVSVIPEGLGGGAQTFSCGTGYLYHNGTPVIAYYVYKDAGHTQMLGQDAPCNELDQSSPMTGTGTGNTQTVTLYGSVAQIYNGAPPGQYSGTLLLQLTF